MITTNAAEALGQYKSTEKLPISPNQQSSGVVMANSLKPVKIGADNIFAQTTRNSTEKKPPGGLVYAPRTKDFGRQNCSVPLASLETVPPALKDHAINPIHH